MGNKVAHALASLAFDLVHDVYRIDCWNQGKGHEQCFSKTCENIQKFKPKNGEKKEKRLLWLCLK